HGIQHIFAALVPRQSWSGENQACGIVVIARNMSREDLNAKPNILRMNPNEGQTSAAEMAPLKT
ncbi:MAG: hypothetical protein AAF761_00255, partial [Pseudomonadota bacterium]